jgi:hypothetical protein
MTQNVMTSAEEAGGPKLKKKNNNYTAYQPILIAVFSYI